MYNLLFGPPPRYARRRLLPLVVELRPKGLLSLRGSQVCSALRASVWPSATRSTSLGLWAYKTPKIMEPHHLIAMPYPKKKLLAAKVP